MEKEKETSLLSRPGDSGSSSLIRTGITLPDDSNGNRGQVTQHTARGGQRGQSTVYVYNMLTPPETAPYNSIYLYVSSVCTSIHRFSPQFLMSLRQQIRLLANVSASARSGGPCLLEFYHFLFKKPFFVSFH